MTFPRNRQPSWPGNRNIKLVLSGHARFQAARQLVRPTHCKLVCGVCFSESTLKETMLSLAALETTQRV